MTKILMLGWEYPPHISGGLGTACQGLSEALARRGIEMTFVVPKVYGSEEADHMDLVSPETVIRASPAKEHRKMVERAEPLSVPSFLLPYVNAEGYEQALEEYEAIVAAEKGQSGKKQCVTASGGSHYGSNIFDEVSRYASLVLAAITDYDFDLIHAHDWMTFPAGVALARQSGKPLVVHVHSLEYDRSGSNGNSGIIDIERLGVTESDAIVAVSHYTKGVIQSQHGVSADKIHVSHNGVYSSAAIEHYRANRDPDQKTVLFLGRVTFQKGPDYFVEAAAKVVPHIPNVRFVLAGSGDMLANLQNRVAELGIADRFEFPGFLRGKAVEEMFSQADLYIMPSVSEPFGISALEAISFDAPALISRQSGVSEVIGHTLKFDFWDTDRLADLIINALQFDELRDDMIAMARQELQKLRWDASAERVDNIYNRVLSGAPSE